MRIKIAVHLTNHPRIKFGIRELTRFPDGLYWICDEGYFDLEILLLVHPDAILTDVQLKSGDQPSLEELPLEEIFK